MGLAIRADRAARHSALKMLRNATTHAGADTIIKSRLPPAGGAFIAGGHVLARDT